MVVATIKGRLKFEFILIFRDLGIITPIDIFFVERQNLSLEIDNMMADMCWMPQSCGIRRPVTSGGGMNQRMKYISWK